MTRKLENLPRDVFEAVVYALADALVRDYRAKWNTPPMSSNSNTHPVTGSPWLTVTEAAQRARCSAATLRREVRAKRLRSVKVGGRKSLRFRAEWIDEWLEEEARTEHREAGSFQPS